MQSQEQIINDLVKSIVELVDPLQIILFGSAARGETTPDSDIDLLVVMPEGTHRRNTLGQLYGSISGLSIDYDLVVVTPEILEEHQNNIGLIYYYALKDGIVIYEKAKAKARIG